MPETNPLNSAAVAPPPGATGASQGADGKMHYKDISGKELGLASENIQQDQGPNPAVENNTASNMTNKPADDDIDLSAGLVAKPAAKAQDDDIDLSAGLVAKPQAQKVDPQLEQNDQGKFVHMNGKSVWQAINKPVGQDVNEKYQTLNTHMNDWIATHAPKGTPDSILQAVVMGVDVPANIMGAIVEAGRRTLSPAGIATLGLAAKLQALKAAQAVPSLVKSAVGAAETATATAFAGSAAAEAMTPRQPGETGLQEFERRVGAAGNALLGVAPVIHGATEAARGAAAMRPTPTISDRAIAAKQEWMKAIPPSSAAPYSDADYEMARNYAEHQHHNVQPIDGPEGVRDAMAKSGEDIDTARAGLVQRYKNEPITTNVNQHVVNGLRAVEKASTKTGIVDRGLAALKDFNLTDMSVEEADNARKQMNAEQREALAQNEWDIATTRRVNPGFVARELALEAIREGEYGLFKQKGVHNADTMSQEETSVINMRNAAERQIFNGDKTRSKTSTAGPIKKVVGKLAAAGVGGVAGEIAGHATGIPGAGHVLGIAGAIAGDRVANAIAPGNRTVNELLSDSLNKHGKVATADPTQLTGTGAPSNPPGFGPPPPVRPNQGPAPAPPGYKPPPTGGVPPAAAPATPTTPPGLLDLLRAPVPPREGAAPAEAWDHNATPSAPIHPDEVADMSRQLGRPVTAEEIPALRREQDAQRNVDAGLAGNRRDVAGEIRQTHRAKLDELDRANKILRDPNSSGEQKQAATETITASRDRAKQIAADLAESLQQDQQDHKLHSALATHYHQLVEATDVGDLKTRFVAEMQVKAIKDEPITPAEKALLQKVNESKANEKIASQQLAQKNVDELKKTSDKSFQDAQKINEKAAQDRQVAADKATADAAAALEKEEALKKEKEESGLHPNQAPPFETEPHLKLPGKWEDRGITGAHVTAHELGHQLMTTEHGYPVEDILSHNHPRTPEGALGSARWDSSSFANKEGKIDLGIMKSKIGDFLDILHGGPVAQEIASGIPMDATYGKAGDLKTAKHWLKQTGFSAVEAAQLMKASELRAREALTHPGVPEIIKRYTTDRQKGLDENYLMSPEALGAAVQEFKNARGGTNAKTDNESANTGKDATSDGKSDTGGASGVSGGSKKGPRPAGKTGAGIGRGRRAEGVTDTKLETAKDNITEKMAKLKENLDPEFHPGVKEVSTGEPAEDAAIKEGGGIPGGFLDMEGYGRVKMFYEPEHGITLGFKPNEAITASAVKAKIAKGREDFGHPAANDVQGELSKTREQARADRHAQTLRGVADEAQKIFEAPPKENLNPEFRDELAAPQQAETSQTKAAITNPAKPDEFKDWESTGPKTADGMVEKGNIDLSKRPLVHRKDGTISTLYSMSIGTPKGEVLLPRVSPDGKILSIADAKALFQKTHQHLGIFKDVDSADKFADLLHRKQVAFQTQRNNGKYNPTMETNE